MFEEWSNPVRAETDEGQTYTYIGFTGTPEPCGVMWFDDDGPFYPYTLSERFGAYGSLEGAKMCAIQAVRPN